MRDLLRHPGLLGLALAMFLTILGNIGVLQFENIYLDQLGAPEALIGVASMVSSVVEVPGMLLADRLVRRHQAGPILLLGMLIFAAARAAIFIFPSVLTVMISKGVAGLAFSFFTIAMIKYVSQRTQGSETATALALLSVTLPSLLNIAGTPLVGYVFDLAGARWLYAFAAAGYLLGSLVLHLSQRARAPKPWLDPA
jgi:PPP family 3-phenylpropionic acid transporter